MTEGWIGDRDKVHVGHQAATQKGGGVVKGNRGRGGGVGGWRNEAARWLSEKKGDMG